MGLMRNANRIFVGNLKGRENLRESAEERLTLKRMLNKTGCGDV
jgi:hypothetical protein